ncbi:MAG: glutamyl-tRNA reductase [Nitrososphaerota archaeon]
MSLNSLHGLLLTHKQLPISRLEKAFFKDLELALKLFKNIDGVEGVAILQTCNRVEVYLDSADEKVVEDILSVWEDLTGDSELKINILLIQDVDVVRHLFRLASGLESMVVGEQEILRQVKEAFYRGLTNNSLSQLLKMVFQEAIRVGKKVRSTTEISRKRLSLAHVAVEVVEKVLKNLNDKVILIIGAGETGELVNSALMEKNYRKITLLFANRTYEKAIQLANLSGGIALKLDQIENYLKIADAVFVTTSAPHYILTRGKVEEAVQERSKPLMIIDLSVPRNVDPNVSHLKNVKLITLDGLREYVDTSVYDRVKELEKIEEFIEDCVAKFKERIETVWVDELISKICCYAERVRLEEVEEAMSMMRHIQIDEKSKEVIQDMSKAIVKRILNPLIENLRKNYKIVDKQQLFNLLKIYFYDLAE